MRTIFFFIPLFQKKIKYFIFRLRKKFYFYLPDENTRNFRGGQGRWESRRILSLPCPRDTTRQQLLCYNYLWKWPKYWKNRSSTTIHRETTSKRIKGAEMWSGTKPWHDWPKMGDLSQAPRSERIRFHTRCPGDKHWEGESITSGLENLQG